MSGLYPYCVVRSGHHPPPDVKGLDDRCVTGRDFGPLTVWVTEAETPPAPDLDRIARHHDVVLAAVGATTPIPVRFGAWASSEEVLSERVLDRRAEIEEALDLVRGKVEFGVSVLERDDEDARDGTSPAPLENGRTYLRELSRKQAARERRKAEQSSIVEDLGARLGDLRRDERIRLLEKPGLVAVAHLVERADEARYRRSVADLARGASDRYRVHLIGPWPPYSFAAS